MTRARSVAAPVAAQHHPIVQPSPSQPHVARLRSVNETAAIFDKGPKTIRRWIKKFQLEAHEINGTYYVPEEAISRLLQRSKVRVR